MNYNIKRYRDLSVISLDEDKYLVIATDSCGSIGEKENDTVALDIATVVENTARVAILEVLSLNATIVNVIDSLTFERKYYGDKVIERMNLLLDELGIDRTALNGTTEDIWPTKESGVVVTVVGIVHKEKARINLLRGNENIYLFGEPLTGKAVEDDKKVADLRTALIVSQDMAVTEMLPIGSRGIKKEVIDLLDEYNYKYNLIIDPILDLPGGPATCYLAFSNDDLVLKYENCKLIGNIFK